MSAFIGMKLNEKKDFTSSRDLIKFSVLKQATLTL